MPLHPESLPLIDSSHHKLDLADYHRAVLQRLFLDHPYGLADGDQESRIKVEAHLEGLAFSGTAAMEKLLRAFVRNPPDQTPALILAAQNATEGDERELVDTVSSWYSSPGSDRIDKLGQRGNAPVASIASAIRNAAAHNVYFKDAGRPDEWLMIFSGGSLSGTFRIQEFVAMYTQSLGRLAGLCDEAYGLATRPDIAAAH